eukprot:10057002-Ditylum_brightwellii.AAC.1
MTSLAQVTEVTAKTAQNQSDNINSQTPLNLENIGGRQTSSLNDAKKAPPNVAPKPGSTSLMEQLLLQTQMQNEQFMLETQRQELQFSQEMTLLQQHEQIDLPQQQPQNINAATTVVEADTDVSTSMNPVEIGTEVAWALHKDKVMSVLAVPPWLDVKQDCKECCHFIEERIKVCPNCKMTKSTTNQELTGAKPEDDNMLSQNDPNILDGTRGELLATRERTKGMESTKEHM